MRVSAQVLIDSMPFFGMIVIELLGTDFRSTFGNYLDQLERDIGDEIPHRDRVENAGSLSTAIETTQTHYIYSLLIVFVLFSSKAIAGGQLASQALGLGLIAFLVVLGLMQYSEWYLRKRAPSKYWVSDCIQLPLPGRRYHIHYGRIGVIVANAVPLLFVLYLDLVGQ